MSAESVVFRQGMADTRAALDRWNRRPGPILRAWLLPSVAVALGLLTAVWLVAEASTPDPSPFVLPGLTRPASFGDVGFLLWRNGLVLALHAMACVAGFMAGSSVPALSESRTGLSRRVHEMAGPAAMAFVAVATLFSLTTQAYALGRSASSLSYALGLSPGELLLGSLAHALPELTALFLPLAAWIVAARRGAWNELLAATAVTVALAVPVLVASAVVETWVTPRILEALAF